MYGQIENNRITSANSELTFEGKLAEDNRWVIMSKLIPWVEFEEEYAQNFAASGMGAPAKSFRIGVTHILHQCINTRFGGRLVPTPAPEQPVDLVYSLPLSVAS